MPILRAPKAVFLITLMLIIGLVITDHMTSPTSTATAAPSELGNACAPCGAPCK